MATIPGPVSMTSYDWMHIYLVSGLWNSEVSLLFEQGERRAWNRCVVVGCFFEEVVMAQEDLAQKLEWHQGC